MKGRWLTLLQIVVTVGALAWIFSDGSRRAEMARVLSHADPLWILAGLGCGLVNEAAGVVRWRLFLGVERIPISWRRTIALHFLGLFTTLFLPGSAGGDAVKMAYLMRDVPERRMPALFSILMDRLSGLVAMFASAAVPLLLRRDWFDRTADTRLLLQGVALVLLFILAIMVLWGVTSLPALRHRHPRWVPFREKLTESAVIFDDFVRGWRATLGAVLISFVSLYSYFLIFYCAGRALRAGVSVVDMLSVLPVMNVVTLLPVSLSGVGLREKTVEPMLRDLCGVPSATGYLISLLGFGLYLFWSLWGAAVLAFYRKREPLKEPA